MIFCLEEDSVLRVYNSPEGVVRSIEALDIEKSVQAMFDESAYQYTVKWLRPNRQHMLFRENGEYCLVRSEKPNEEGLVQAIRAARAIEPERFEQVVREVEGRLRAHGGSL